MTTGVRYVEDYEALDSDIAATDIASGWKRPNPDFPAPACIWDQILTLTEKVREHGTQFQYRSIETDVLAHCLERVTQTRLAELVSRELWHHEGEIAFIAFFNHLAAVYPFPHSVNDEEYLPRILTRPSAPALSRAK